MNTILKDDPILQKAHSEYIKFTHDDELREIYESRLKYKRDHLSLLRNAEKKGEERGAEKGAQENKLETAQKMIEDGFSIENICKYTGLSVYDIKKLLP